MRPTSRIAAALIERLETLRESAGMTPEALARSSGIGRATWFNHRSAKGASLLVCSAERIAAALDSPLGISIGGVDVVSGSSLAVPQSAGHVAKMSDQVAQIVAFMDGLDERQQDRVLRMVLNAIQLAHVGKGR